MPLEIPTIWDSVKLVSGRKEEQADTIRQTMERADLTIKKMQTAESNDKVTYAADDNNARILDTTKLKIGDG